MLKNTIRGQLLRIAVVVLMAAVPAQATILYGNLGNAADLGAFVYATSTPDQGFSTDGNNYNLNSVTVGLFNDGSGGSITAYLYSDVAGAPGAVLANLGTISDSVIFCCGFENDITFTPSSTVSLNGYSTYFVLLQGTTQGDVGHDAQWASAIDNSGTGVAGQPGSYEPAYSLVMSVQATSTGIATAPEPGAGLLLLAGVAALPLMRKRLNPARGNPV
jgi:MYXO-CTERM domain-containing protein